MKIYILFACLVAIAWAGPLQAQNKKIAITVTEELVRQFIADIEKAATPREIVAIINEYADRIFANISEFMIHNGLDPYPMPDIHEGFSYTIIITFHGELDLTNGWLQDVSSIHRDGDAKVIYDPNVDRLQVVVPIAFNILAFNYDYSATIMDLGPSGGVEGKISNLKVEVTIGFDFTTFQAAMDSFYIIDAGKIDLNFSGNVLIDWLLNLLVDVATAALHRVILLIMEAIVRNPIELIVDAVNAILNGILHPTTTVPPAEILNYLK